MPLLRGLQRQSKRTPWLEIEENTIVENARQTNSWARIYQRMGKADMENLRSKSPILRSRMRTEIDPPCLGGIGCMGGNTKLFASYGWQATVPLWRGAPIDCGSFGVYYHCNGHRDESLVRILNHFGESLKLPRLQKARAPPMIDDEEFCQLDVEQWLERQEIEKNQDPTKPRENRANKIPKTLQELLDQGIVYYAKEKPSI